MLIFRGCCEAASLPLHGPLCGNIVYKFDFHEAEMTFHFVQNIEEQLAPQYKLLVALLSNLWTHTRAFTIPFFFSCFVSVLLRTRKSDTFPFSFFTFCNGFVRPVRTPRSCHSQLCMGVLRLVIWQRLLCLWRLNLLLSTPHAAYDSIPYYPFAGFGNLSS